MKHSEKTLPRFFAGFSPAAMPFLQEIEQRNSKPWFEENRPLYDSLLMTPFRAMVNELAPLMLSIDSHFEVRPGINRTISRIYRDVRFSKSKRLFRNSMWLTFKRPSKVWHDTPCFFFEIMPGRYRYGMGYYSATPQTMQLFRQTVTKDPKAFTKMTDFIGRGVFALEGEDYKRPKASDCPASLYPWIQKRSFYIAANKQPNERLFSPHLVDDLIEGFTVLSPLYLFLREIADLRYQKLS